jgi:hypothetical protein
MIVDLCRKFDVAKVTFKAIRKFGSSCARYRVGRRLAGGGCRSEPEATEPAGRCRAGDPAARVR